jgi:hypothetical protein
MGKSSLEEACRGGWLLSGMTVRETGTLKVPLMVPLANSQKWLRLGPGLIGGTSMEVSWHKCGPGVLNYRARFPGQG